MTRALSTSEAAAALRIAPSTLQKYARDGKVPFDVTPGGHRRFDLAEVRQALDQCEPAAPAVNPRRAVILTALPSEYDAVRRRLANPTPRRLESGTRYEVGELEGESFIWEIAVAEIGAGNEAAAIEATRAIETLKPDLLVFVGVAGSLKPDDAPAGSVVVATRIYGYEYGKADKQFLPRPISFPTAHALEQLSRSVVRDDWTATAGRPPALVGAIAAGNSVVSSDESELWKRIRTVYSDAVAVEMESLGLYMAAHRSRGLGVLSVRGISDCVTDKNPTSDAKMQPIAADNAAELAFMILAKMHHDDLGPGGELTVEVLESLRFEALLPSSVLEELERLTANGLLRWHLQTYLSSSEIDPGAIARAIVNTPPPWMEDEAWATVAEYCNAYEILAEATVAFNRAAECGDRPGRNFARAALCQAALENPQESEALLRRALGHGSNDLNLAVVKAALANDAEAIVRGSEGLGSDHRLELMFRARALAALDRANDALALADSILEDSPGTTSAALLVAELLIGRAEAGESPHGAEDDLLRAQSLALSARDLRRQWRGDSSKAARVAITAGIVLTDPGSVLELALPAPDGQATAAEAADPRIQQSAAHSALALGETTRARVIVDSMQPGPLRSLLQGEVLLAENRVAEAEPLLRDALAHGTDDEKSMALYGLAKIGSLGDDDLAAVGNLRSDGLDAIRVAAEIAKGELENAAVLARGGSEPSLIASVAEAFAEAGDLERAVELADLAADTSHDPDYRAMAASMLRRKGELGAAIAKAETALGETVPGTARHRKIRRLCIKIASEGEMWRKAVDHSKTALSEGDEQEDIRWTLAFCLNNLEAYSDALGATLDSPPLRPRTGNEALLVVSLEAHAARGTAGAKRVLEIAEDFLDDERVADAAFTALLMLTSEIEFDPDISNRLSSVSDEYFNRYSDTGAVRRFSAQPEELPAALEAALAPSSTERDAFLTDTLQKIRSGAYPLVMIAATTGRSYAEAIVKRAAGFQPACATDRQSVNAELAAAESAIGGPIVVESSAIDVMMSAGYSPRRLLAHFSRVVASAAAKRDAITAATGLRMKSTSFLGWDAAAGRPTLTEVQEETAELWSVKARTIVGVFEAAECVPVYPGVERTDSGLAALHPVEIAKARGLSLLSDDTVIRVMATSEGVPTFGTKALLDVLRTRDLISKEAHEAALMNLRLDAVVDLEWDAHAFEVAGEMSDWNVTPAIAASLSRPAFWSNPAVAWDAIRPAVVRAGGAGTVVHWISASIFGLKAAGVPRHVIGGFLAVSCMAIEAIPQPLRVVLEGARSGGEVQALEDFCEAFLETLRPSIEEDVLARTFMLLLEPLDPEDRARAMQILLRPSPAVD